MTPPKYNDFDTTRGPVAGLGAATSPQPLCMALAQGQRLPPCACWGQMWMGTCGVGVRKEGVLPLFSQRVRRAGVSSDPTCAPVAVVSELQPRRVVPQGGAHGGWRYAGLRLSRSPAARPVIAWPAERPHVWRMRRMRLGHVDSGPTAGGRKT